MRSELVFAAIDHFPNRYALTVLSAKASRKLHRPNTRVEDTINDALRRLGQAPESIAPHRPMAAILQPAASGSPLETRQSSWRESPLTPQCDGTTGWTAPPAEFQDWQPF